ncbi:unnamed protein product [Microthlaspi erraticum]|uniref:Uncharacterized protein n=1 Tax=Microthlaspi erraticum TaxID=1685480 RepID=A0A6D2JP98_9BRAS|nr:unnamed protein product [Microthlaspi erraticum]
MERVGEDEEKSIEEEASTSVEETRSDNKDERSRETITELVDTVGSTEEVSTDPSNSQSVTFEDHDVNGYEMEDEQVVELSRRNSRVKPEVSETNTFPYLNKSEGMVLQFQEETPAETEQTNVLFHGLSSLNSPEIHEGTKSS